MRKDITLVIIIIDGLSGHVIESVEQVVLGQGASVSHGMPAQELEVRMIRGCFKKVILNPALLVVGGSESLSTGKSVRDLQNVDRT